MAKALQHWKVLPHGPLEKISDSILTVVGEFNMPLTRFERRMTVVRLRDNRLVIFSCIALDDAQMRVLEDFGTPAFLVVPNHIHRSDALIWKARYPQITVVAPGGVRKEVEEIVPLDTTAPDFGDDAVRFVEIAGTRGRDSALEIHSDSGVTLVVNDLIGNMPRETSWVLRAMGFAGEKPRVPLAVKLGIVKDKDALRAQLEGWGKQNVTRILVSHGRTIETNAAATLRDLAASL